MKKTILYISAILFTVVLTAQNTERVFINAETINGGAQVAINVNDGYYLIRPFSTHVIETSFIPNGERLKPESHTVILEPNTSKFEISENEQDIRLKTNGDVYVTITKSPFQITYYYKDQRIT